MKGYREQYIECRNNGNLIEVDISTYGYDLKVALICLKNKAACNSKLCSKERKLHIGEKDE